MDIGVSRKFSKLTAFATFLLFSINSVAWGQIPLQVYSLPANSLSVPNEWGIVKEIKTGSYPASPDHPYLIHIQDAHSNYAAQKNIANILDHLRKEEKIRLVFVEGARGTLDARYLSFSEDRRLNKKIADRLARMGELTAADIFLLRNAKGLEFVGLEEPALYREDIEALRKVFRQEPEIREWIRMEENRLDRDLSRLGSKDLIAILRIYLHFTKKQSALVNVISTLDRLSRRHLARDLREAKEQREFPNLVRLLRLKDEEGKVDLEKVREEARLLNSEFGIRNSELKNIIDSFIPHSALRTPHSETNPRFLLEKIYTDLKPQGFDFRKYPEFSRHAKHLIYQYELESAELFEEIEHWMNLLMTELARKPEEKQMAERVREMKLVEKLLLLELAREEWGEVRSSDFSRLKIATEVATTSLHFYRLAEAREQVFLETIRRTMKAKNESRAVVITGGFHTDALSEFFEKSSWSYGVVSPHVKGDSRGNYIKTLLGRSPKDIDTSEASNAPWAMSRSDASSLGVDVDHRRDLVDGIAASLGKGPGSSFGSMSAVLDSLIQTAAALDAQTRAHLADMSGTSHRPPDRGEMERLRSELLVLASGIATRLDVSFQQDSLRRVANQMIRALTHSDPSEAVREFLELHILVPGEAPQHSTSVLLNGVKALRAGTSDFKDLESDLLTPLGHKIVRARQIEKWIQGLDTSRAAIIPTYHPAKRSLALSSEITGISKTFHITDDSTLEIDPEYIVVARPGRREYFYAGDTSWQSSDWTSLGTSTHRMGDFVFHNGEGLLFFRYLGLEKEFDARDSSLIHHVELLRDPDYPDAPRNAAESRDLYFIRQAGRRPNYLVVYSTDRSDSTKEAFTLAAYEVEKRLMLARFPGRGTKSGRMIFHLGDFTIHVEGVPGSQVSDPLTCYVWYHQGNQSVMAAKFSGGNLESLEKFFFPVSGGKVSSQKLYARSRDSAGQAYDELVSSTAGSLGKSPEPASEEEDDGEGLISWFFDRVFGDSDRREFLAGTAKAAAFLAMVGGGVFGGFKLADWLRAWNRDQAGQQAGEGENIGDDPSEAAPDSEEAQAQRIVEESAGYFKPDTGLNRATFFPYDRMDNGSDNPINERAPWTQPTSIGKFIQLLVDVAEGHTRLLVNVDERSGRRSYLGRDQAVDWLVTVLTSLEGVQQNARIGWRGLFPWMRWEGGGLVRDRDEIAFGDNVNLSRKIAIVIGAFEGSEDARKRQATELAQRILDRQEAGYLAFYDSSRGLFYGSYNRREDRFNHSYHIDRFFNEFRTGLAFVVSYFRLNERAWSNLPLRIRTYQTEAGETLDVPESFNGGAFLYSWPLEDTPEEELAPNLGTALHNALYALLDQSHRNGDLGVPSASGNPRGGYVGNIGDPALAEYPDNILQEHRDITSIYALAGFSRLAPEAVRRWLIAYSNAPGMRGPFGPYDARTRDGQIHRSYYAIDQGSVALLGSHGPQYLLRALELRRLSDGTVALERFRALYDRLNRALAHRGVHGTIGELAERTGGDPLRRPAQPFPDPPAEGRSLGEEEDARYFASLERELGSLMRRFRIPWVKSETSKELADLFQFYLDSERRDSWGNLEALYRKALMDSVLEMVRQADIDTCRSVFLYIELFKYWCDDPQGQHMAKRSDQEIFKNGLKYSSGDDFRILVTEKLKNVEFPKLELLGELSLKDLIIKVAIHARKLMLEEDPSSYSTNLPYLLAGLPPQERLEYAKVILSKINQGKLKTPDHYQRHSWFLSYQSLANSFPRRIGLLQPNVALDLYEFGFEDVYAEAAKPLHDEIEAGIGSIPVWNEESQEHDIVETSEDPAKGMFFETRGMTEGSLNLMIDFFKYNPSPELLKGVISFFEKTKSPEGKFLLSDKERNILHAIINHIPKSEKPRDRRRQLHQFVLDLVHRRFTNPKDPVIRFMSEVITRLEMPREDIEKRRENVVAFLDFVLAFNQFPEEFKTKSLDSLMSMVEKPRLSKEDYQALEMKLDEIILDAFFERTVMMTKKEKTRLQRHLKKNPAAWARGDLFKRLVHYHSFVDEAGKRAVERYLLKLTLSKVAGDRFMNIERYQWFGERLVEKFRKGTQVPFELEAVSDGKLDRYAFIWHEILNHARLLDVPSSDFKAVLEKRWKDAKGGEEDFDKLWNVFESVRQALSVDQPIDSGRVQQWKEALQKINVAVRMPEWSEVLINLDQINAVQKVSRGGKVKGYFEVTEDPVAFIESGEKPYYTCQRCNERTGQNKSGEPINRASHGQFILARMVSEDGEVASRSILEIAKEFGSNKKVLLVERIYEDGSVPTSEFQRHIMDWVLEDDEIDYVVFANARPDPNLGENIQVYFIETDGNVYRDSFRPGTWWAIDVEKYRVRRTAAVPTMDRKLSGYAAASSLGDGNPVPPAGAPASGAKPSLSPPAAAVLLPGIVIPRDEEALIRVGDYRIYVNRAGAKIVAADGEQKDVVLFDESDLSPRERRSLVGAKLLPKAKWAASRDQLKDPMRELEELAKVVLLRNPPRDAKGVLLKNEFYVNVRDPKSERIRYVLDNPPAGEVRRLAVKITEKDDVRRKRFDLLYRDEHSREADYNLHAAKTRRLETREELEEIGLSREEVQNKDVYVQEPLVLFEEVIENAIRVDLKEHHEYFEKTKILISQFVRNVTGKWRLDSVDLNYTVKHWGVNRNGKLVFNNFEAPMGNGQFSRASLDDKLKFIVNFIVANYAFLYEKDWAIFAKPGKDGKVKAPDTKLGLAVHFLKEIGEIRDESGAQFLSEILSESAGQASEKDFRVLLKMEKYRTGDHSKTFSDFFRAAIVKRNEDLGDSGRFTGDTQIARLLKNVQASYDPPDPREMEALWTRIHLEPFKNFRQKESRFLNLRLALTRMDELDRIRPRLSGSKHILIGTGVPDTQLRLAGDPKANIYLAVLRMREGNEEVLRVIDLRAPPRGEPRVVYRGKRGSLPIWKRVIVRHRLVQRMPIKMKVEDGPPAALPPGLLNVPADLVSNLDPNTTFLPEEPVSPARPLTQAEEGKALDWLGQMGEAPGSVGQPVSAAVASSFADDAESAVRKTGTGGSLGALPTSARPAILPHLDERKSEDIVSLLIQEFESRGIPIQTEGAREELKQFVGQNPARNVVGVPAVALDVADQVPHRTDLVLFLSWLSLNTQSIPSEDIPIDVSIGDLLANVRSIENSPFSFLQGLANLPLGLIVTDEEASKPGAVEGIADSLAGRKGSTVILVRNFSNEKPEYFGKLRTLLAAEDIELEDFMTEDPSGDAGLLGIHLKKHSLIFSLQSMEDAHSIPQIRGRNFPRFKVDDKTLKAERLDRKLAFSVYALLAQAGDEDDYRRAGLEPDPKDGFWLPTREFFQNLRALYELAREFEQAA